MDPEIEKILKNQWGQLPEEVKSLFSDPLWADRLLNIGIQNSLSKEQVKILETETVLVMLGLANPDLYQKELGERLLIGPDKAQTIAREVEIEVFKNLKDSFKKIYHESEIEFDPGYIEHPEGATEKFEEKPDEHLSKLPKDIQENIVDAKYQNTLYQIGENSNLTVGQMGLLEECIDNVILGVTPPSEFNDSVEKKLKLDPDKARLLVNQINEKILKQIRVKMMGESNPQDHYKISKEDEEILDFHGIKILDDKYAEYLAKGQVDAKKIPPADLKNLDVPEITAPHEILEITEAKPEPKLIEKIKPTPPSSAPKKVSLRSYPEGEDPYRIKPE